MATRKKTNEEREYVTINSFSVNRAFETKNNAIFFDAVLNGITIYGMRVVDGQRGAFISFPSQKGNDGKYYNTSFAYLSPEDQDKIIQTVYDLLDAKK